MMYVVAAVAIVAVILAALGAQNLLGPSIRLFVMDSGYPSSTLFQFRTRLSGGLAFESKAALGQAWFSSGVVVDSAGKLYVCAWSEDPSRPGAAILSSTDPARGFVAAITGSGFTFPVGLAVDATGTLYAADKGHIDEFGENTSSVLVFSMGAEVGGIGPILFNVATGVALDNQGNIYVVSGNDPQTQRTGFPQVSVYDRGYSNLALIGPTLGPDGRTVTARWLKDPRQVALDDSGYVYVTQGGPPAKIVVFPPSPRTLPDASGEINCTQFQFPAGISVFRNVIYVADPVARAVFVFSPAAIVPFDSGQVVQPIQTIVGGDVPFAGPFGVAAVALPWFLPRWTPVIRS